MRKILISTIVRDREQHLPTWFEQIEKFVQQLPNIEFSLSVYENDSIDNSIQIISQCVVPKYFKFFNFKHEQINTEMYDSVRDRPDRVKNLAKARNKTIFSPAIDLNYFDNILIIEPDIQYEAEDALKIINYEGIRIYRIFILEFLLLSAMDVNCFTILGQHEEPHESGEEKCFPVFKPFQLENFGLPLMGFVYIMPNLLKKEFLFIGTMKDLEPLIATLPLFVKDLENMVIVKYTPTRK